MDMMDYKNSITSKYAYVDSKGHEHFRDEEYLVAYTLFGKPYECRWDDCNRF